MIRRGEVWWASLAEPRGSGPGDRRPVLIVQSDDFNDSRIAPVVVAALTTNHKVAAAPGNVLCRASESGLRKDSVVNLSQLLTIDKSFLTECVRAIPSRLMARVEDGMRLVLSL